MNKASDILGRVARRLDRPEAALAWLTSSWPQIVGKTLAGHTRPLRCQTGRLDIAADAKAWQKQLEQMTHDFCARINEAWGSSLIREVKFVAGKRACTRPDGSSAPTRQRIPYEFDNDHIPFIRHRK